MFADSYDQQLFQYSNNQRPILMPIMDKNRKPDNAVGEKIAPNCPRCASSNTKFCYYNNYSLSQPRYFCKGCRRYWTKGGSLRNVPVGGGCRKNRRSRSIKHLAQSSNNGSDGFFRKQDEPFGSVSSSSDSDSVVSQSSANHIDLAAVFAKYLINGQSNINQEFHHDDHAEINDDVVNKFGSQSTPAFTGEELLLPYHQPQHMVSVAEKERQEQRVGLESMEYDEFGLLSLLEDEMIQDVLRSDNEDNQSFSWQPIVQLQDFDSFSDPSKINPPNHFSDNWSSFDLSGFDIFSKPYT